MGETSSVTAMTNDDIAIVQTWGVHTNVFCADDTVAAGAYLTTHSTVAGECADKAATDMMPTGTDATLHGQALTLVGMALTADTTFTRGTATEECCTGFIRCDW